MTTCRTLSAAGLMALLPLAILLIGQFARRLLFVIRHGGMDCATCQGSPLAFVIGWGIESLALLLVGWLIHRLRRSLRTDPNTAKK